MNENEFLKEYIHNKRHGHAVGSGVVIGGDGDGHVVLDHLTSGRGNQVHDPSMRERGRIDCTRW